MKTRKTDNFKLGDKVVFRKYLKSFNENRGMIEMFKEIEEKVKEISKLDYVSDAYLDKDCLSEGYLSIQIELKEDEED